MLWGVAVSTAFHVGQVVLVALTGNSRGPVRLVERKVTKVGRKWVTLEHDTRFEREGERGKFVLDGGDYSSPGRVYLSLQDYEDEEKLYTAWSLLRNVVERCRSDQFTYEQLFGALMALGIGEEVP